MPFQNPVQFGNFGRRPFLGCASGGLAAMAFAWLMQRDGVLGATATKGLHFPARAKRVIHVFSPGGVSQVDTFDYKPQLEKLDGTSLTNKGDRKSTRLNSSH